MMLMMTSGMLFPTGRTTTPELVGDAIVADTVSLIRGPTVHMVTNHSARIMWKTDSLANSTVEYGLTDANLDTKITNATLSTEHRVDLDGLDVGTRYYYRVISNGTASAVYNFKTAPADDAPFKLIVVGDNRPGSDTAPVQPAVFSDLIDRIILEDPDIVVMTGDYVYSISTSDSDNWNSWSKFTNITDRLGHYVPIYAVIGNHDYEDWSGTPRPQYFLDAFEMFDEPRLYSSFDFAGVHFTLLNSEEKGYTGQIRGEQWTWLVNDLTSANNKTKFVFAHRPLYPLSHINSAMDVNKTNRDELQQLFEDTNVTMFAAGHDHLFDRLTVNGVVHVIAGGGGAPVYSTPWGGDYYHYFRVEVETGHINMTSVTPEGEDVENYQLPYTGPIEIEIRVVANNSQKRVGTVPEIYFSEVPKTTYYSWDGSTNATTLSGIPNEDGLHTLDVYAEDADGVWSHERFVFTAVGASTTSSSTTPTSSATDGLGSLDGLTIMIIGVGALAVVVVVVVLVRVKR